MRFDKQFLMKALPNAILKYENFPRYPNVSVDSRTLVKDDIFVALKGKYNNGHDFILDALKAGASGLILQESEQAFLAKIDHKLLQDKLVIIVPDSYQALIQLATAWREQLNCKVVGVTGSVGKSSTKEILRNILDEAKMKVEENNGTLENGETPSNDDWKKAEDALMDAIINAKIN